MWKYPSNIFLPAVIVLDFQLLEINRKVGEDFVIRSSKNARYFINRKIYQKSTQQESIFLLRKKKREMKRRCATV